jgi:hypothetical protein
MVAHAAADLVLQAGLFRALAAVRLDGALGAADLGREDGACAASDFRGAGVVLLVTLAATILALRHLARAAMETLT